MWRTVRALTIVVIGWALLLAPLESAIAQPTFPASGTSASGVSAPGPSGAVASQPSSPAPAGEVVAQEPQQNLDQQNSDSDQQLPARQRMVIGIAGIGLIALVVGSRKLRKKPVFFVTWKRKR